eukprot:6758381-Prymnesium_polylepis.2
MDCAGAAVFLTEIVRGGMLTEGGYRFTVLTTERELRLRAPDNAEYEKWLAALQPDGSTYHPMSFSSAGGSTEAISPSHAID